MFVGRVYKIWAPGLEKCYIGSTRLMLKRRFLRHKSNMKAWQEGRYCYCTSYQVLAHEGVQIELVHEDEFGDAQELHECEKYWISKFETVNKINPTTTRDEYQQKRHEWRRHRVPCPVCGVIMRRDCAGRHQKNKHQ